MARALDAWLSLASPPPAAAAVVCDGPASPAALAAADRLRARLVETAPVAVGFCRATSACWQAGAELGTPYILHLEHDFLLRQPLALAPLAHLLDRRRDLAQVALCRQAVSAEEVAAGGLVASRPGTFTSRGAYLEHEAYFTTNPCLLRASFLRGVCLPLWPESPHCEGRFGCLLRSLGYRFAIWGQGEEWVEHVGQRDGFGY
ncbi:MAG: hypothetical protein QN122_12080 [Armatimonadota bacterium]|nr:hypothetical protein [Armatimonadota bacterium]